MFKLWVELSSRHSSMIINPFLRLVGACKGSIRVLQWLYKGSNHAPSPLIKP